MPLQCCVHVFVQRKKANSLCNLGLLGKVEMSHGPHLGEETGWPLGYGFFHVKLMFSYY